MALSAACAAGPAQAQVQRSFVNLGFELPALGGNNCFLVFSADSVPGWDTDHPPGQVSGTCTLAGSPVGSTITRPIEIWRRVQSGIAPRAGSQHAELNAVVAARMSQTVCLVQGEVVGWRLSHRGREGTDVMSFNVDSSANEIARVSTTTGGVGTVVAGSCGSGLVGGAVCNAPATVVTPAPRPTTWADYTGSFTWNGASGSHNVGFQAISSASGHVAVGNLIDEIQITLRPFVEFTNTRYASREGQAAVVPRIRVFGTVPAGGMVVGVAITGGTATLGSDYFTASGTATVNVTVPAGTYDNTSFDLPITSVANDSLIEDNETVILGLQANPLNYTLSSTEGCNQAAVADATLLLLDNDVDVRVDKTVANAHPPAGGDAVFSVSVRNNTARPTVGTGVELQAHDATATLADALPAGFTAFSWTCAASGSPAPACPAASGTGAINAAVALPAGNGGAAGGALTYTVTGTLDPARCTSLSNTAVATIVTPAAEATAAQSGFVTPAPGGTANNTATAAVDPGCLVVNKLTPASVGGPFGFVLGNTTQAGGSATTTAADTAVQVDGNAAAGVQPFGIVAAGAALTIAETPAAGFELSGASCRSGGVDVGSRAGNVYTIAAADVVGGADFDCTFSNQRQPILRLQKTFSNGRFGDGDQMLLSIAPASGAATEVVTSGSGAAVTSPAARVDPASAGSVYTLSERAATTVPATDLGNYTATVTCTNATAGSVTPLPPAGSAYPAGGFAITPALDDDISCTLANARGAISDLSISKTNTPQSGPLDRADDSATRGVVAAYRMVVRNHGPDAVTGAIVRDPASTGLACSAVTCSGAACPASVTVAALQGAGVVLGSLTSGDTVSFDLSCTVQ